MANQYFRSQFSYSKQGMPVRLFAKVTFGATGAPTMTNAQGITSITRNSAGKYTFVLSDTYNTFLNMSKTQIGGTSGADAQAAPIFSLVSQTVATAATKNIVVQYYAIDSTTATDPASGETAYFTFELNNSSV